MTATIRIAAAETQIILSDIRVLSWMESAAERTSLERLCVGRHLFPEGVINAVQKIRRALLARLNNTPPDN